VVIVELSGVTPTPGETVNARVAGFTVPFRGTDDDIDLACVQRLVGRGYGVSMPGKWETREELCKRIGISVRKFSRRMKKSKFMPPVDIERCDGDRGRIRCIRSNGTFDRWLLYGQAWGQKTDKGDNEGPLIADGPVDEDARRAG